MRFQTNSTSIWPGLFTLYLESTQHYKFHTTHNMFRHTNLHTIYFYALKVKINDCTKIQLDMDHGIIDETCSVLNKTSIQEEICSGKANINRDVWIWMCLQYGVWIWKLKRREALLLFSHYHTWQISPLLSCKSLNEKR